MRCMKSFPFSGHKNPFELISIRLSFFNVIFSIGTKSGEWVDKNGNALKESSGILHWTFASSGNIPETDFTLKTTGL